jgi:hypothetical protein
MNPLDEILQSYNTTRDALRMAQRVVQQNITGAITDRHSFFGQTVQENESRLQTAQEELDTTVVLSLVAAFERLLRNHVMQELDQQLTCANEVHRGIRTQVNHDVEFWRIADDLVAVFVTVSANVRGQARQMVEFRDWVAHGKRWKSVPEAPSTNVIPVYAHRILSDFLRSAGVI